MSLNKKKSGIVIFANRKTKKIPLMKVEKTSIPSPSGSQNRTISAEFQSANSTKYLGTLLNTKLTCGPQIGHVKKKSAHLYAKLYPYLFHATAEGRRDMWQTMVSPLFNAALPLLYFEPSKSHRDNLERLQRCTFKQFLMVSKRTNTVLTEGRYAKERSS